MQVQGPPYGVWRDQGVEGSVIIAPRGGTRDYFDAIRPIRVTQLVRFPRA